MCTEYERSIAKKWSEAVSEYMSLVRRGHCDLEQLSKADAKISHFEKEWKNLTYKKS